MKKRRVELRLLALDHVDVALPSALRVGRRDVVGKTYDAEEDGYICKEEPELVVLLGAEASSDLPYFAHSAKIGELMPADKATADLLGVSFKGISLWAL